MPCHDEEDVLPTLYDEVMTAAHRCATRVELIVVDDGSSDATLSLARGLADRDARVRVLTFSRNFGKEAAMLAGLRAARGDAVIVMDADLQHPPHLIEELVAVHERGFDQVVARRDRRGDPKLRSATSRAYYRIINRLIDVRLEDGVGDFRLLSRRAVDALLQLGEVNRFSKGLFSWIGFPTAAVDYANVARGAGTSSWSFRTLFNYGLDGLISFNDKPLRISVWMGLSAVLCAFLYVGWLAIRFVQYGVEAPGYLTTIAVIVMLGGFQLIFLGILGEYIGRIYYESKKRPHFIVATEYSQGSGG